jgi:hypothetical protein
MSRTLMEKPVSASALSGTAVLQRVRSLLIVALAGALVYSILNTATWARCLGGYDGTGGFINESGEATDLAPMCLTVTLRPNATMYVVLALVVIGALSSILKKARSEMDALRYLTAARVVIVVLVIISVVVSHVWFWNLPVDGWDGGATNFISPNPFGSVTAVVAPQVG